MDTEQVSVVWTRPDGRVAVRVDFPLPDERSATDLVAQLLERKRCARIVTPENLKARRGAKR